MFRADFGGSEAYEEARGLGTITSAWYHDWALHSYHPPPGTIPSDLTYRILAERHTAASFGEPIPIGAPGPADLEDQDESWLPLFGKGLQEVPPAIVDATTEVVDQIAALTRITRELVHLGNREAAHRVWIPLHFPEQDIPHEWGYVLLTPLGAPTTMGCAEVAVHRGRWYGTPADYTFSEERTVVFPTPAAETSFSSREAFLKWLSTEACSLLQKQTFRHPSLADRMGLGLVASGSQAERELKQCAAERRQGEPSLSPERQLPTPVVPSPASDAAEAANDAEMGATASDVETLSVGDSPLGGPPTRLKGKKVKGGKQAAAKAGVPAPPSPPGAGGSALAASSRTAPASSLAVRKPHK